MLTSLLLWLDASAVRYWSAVALTGAGTVALALSRSRSRWLPGLFWVVLTLTLLAGRWPGVLFPTAFCVDEDEFLAQALTAVSDPVPWKGFDGQTSGPLNTLALVPAAWVGAPLSYVSARLIGLGTVLVGLWALQRLLRLGFGDSRTARIGILPLLGFYTLTDFNDFMHYTSEHLPVALEMVAFSVTAALGFAERRRVFGLALGAGFLLGIIPFTKLQAVPAALVTTVAGYGFLLVRRRELGDGRWRRVTVCFTLAGLAFPAGIAGWLVVNGVFGDFVRSYLEMQFVYLNQPDPAALSGLWERVPDFWAWFWPTLVWSAVGVPLAWTLGRWRPWGRSGWLLVGSALAVLVTSAYEIYQPHRPYGHYLLFAVFPAGTLAAIVFGMLHAPKPERLGVPVPAAGVGRGLLIATFLLVGITPMVFRRVQAGHLWRGRLPEFLAHQNSQVVERLRAHLPPAATGERSMAVWGWWPELFVATQTRTGTRDAHAQHQIEAGPMQGYYRERFLADLRRNRPVLFVEAIAPGAAAFSSRETQGFATFPQLAEYIADHYTLVEEVAGVRIFSRRDWAPAPEVPAPTPAQIPPGPVSVPPVVPPPGEVMARMPGEPVGSAVGTPSSPAVPATPPSP